jgi:uncharacterized metal-binding protein (TIGR02443 family)
MTQKRQFIAGATCPECGKLDKIQRVEEDGRLWMTCIACGMVRDLDQQPAADSGTPVTIMPPPRGKDS